MKEKLLLHVCCAPDEAYVIHLLNDTCLIRCFFSNPNIQPEEEYIKRCEEARRVAQHFGVEFDSPPYEPQLWEKAIAGLEDTAEGGDRCGKCFLLRLRQTAQFCTSIGWQRFTTVMSISPHKRIQMLNDAGSLAARESGVEYVPFDFKKKDGFRKSVVMGKELGLYRQNYCGCRLSKAESEIRRQQGADKEGAAR